MVVAAADADNPVRLDHRVEVPPRSEQAGMAGGQLPPRALQRTPLGSLTLGSRWNAAGRGLGRTHLCLRTRVELAATRRGGRRSVRAVQRGLMSTVAAFGPAACMIGTAELPG